MKTKLVIFGITGDLSTRKLLPALKHIYETGDYDDMEVIGVSRREPDMAELLTKSVGDASLTDKFRIVSMDLANSEDYVRLREEVALKSDEQAVIYLSVPPSASADIVEFLGRAGLNSPNVKLLFEKPFGFDLESAKDYLQRTAEYFTEAQIYRIDHYAAKEIAQQIISLKSDAENHHYHWSNESLAAVEVIASEAIGIEDRTSFYEETGALRDFVQGHLLQILALVLMKTTENFDMEELPKLRYEALKNIKPADPNLSTRAQYDGYKTEVGAPHSETETFVQLQLESTDPRWKGVLLHVTTGKNLDKKRSFVSVHYKDGHSEVFDEDLAHPTDGRKLDAYERVLIEAIAGNKALFISGDEVLRAWEIVKPVQEAWDMNGTPLKTYKPGSTIDTVLH